MIRHYRVFLDKIKYTVVTIKIPNRMAKREKAVKKATNKEEVTDILSVTLKKVGLWLISFFAIAASFFGALADGQSVFVGCNSPKSLDELDLKNIQFKRYEGRMGGTFLFPSDWEQWVEPDFPSQSRLILHPENPEISIEYSDIFYP
jgi:hypothetical protein